MVPHSTYKKFSPNPALHLVYEQHTVYASQYNKMRDSSLLAYNDRVFHHSSSHHTPGLIPEDRLLETVLGSQERLIANRLCHLQLAGYKNSQEYSRESLASPA